MMVWFRNGYRLLLNPSTVGLSVAFTSPPDCTPRPLGRPSGVPSKWVFRRLTEHSFSIMSVAPS